MTTRPLAVLRHRFHFFTLLLCLGVWLGAPVPTRATVMVEMPVDDLIRGADLVVRGKVLRTGVRVRATPSGVLEPRTHVWIAVDEVLTGAAPEGGVVHLWEPGGRAGDVETTVAGTPHYEQGEHVFVFLSQDKQERGLYRTLELTQGKYTIDTAGGDQLAVRDMADVSIVRWRRKRMEIGPPSTDKPINVRKLSARVRALRLAPENLKELRR